MEDALLLEKVTKLPDDLKSEVADFVDFLLSKKKNEGARNRASIWFCKRVVYYAARF